MQNSKLTPEVSDGKNRLLDFGVSGGVWKPLLLNADNLHKRKGIGFASITLIFFLSFLSCLFGDMISFCVFGRVILYALIDVKYFKIFTGNKNYYEKKKMQRGAQTC